MEQVAFCERNTKIWVTLLVSFGVLVLAYSLWVAWERGEFSGFSHRRTNGASGAHSPSKTRNLPPQQRAPSPMTPVALGPLPSQGQVGTPPIDQVTRATPQGGIQFIGGANATNLQHAFNQAADIIRPSVVSINAAQGNFSRPNGGVQPGGARFIDPFDGTPDLRIGQMNFENVGSGVIVDSSGYIVTNHHVVKNATLIIVSPVGPRGNHVKAELVAVDKNTDLALLRLEGEHNLPAAHFADSSRIEVGDWVLAVGNPFGLERTVTAGIISGIRNSLTIGNAHYRNLIQTDAPINRGSSGGPLVDVWGNVIGINTAIYAPTGVFSGTGFAIPSNRVGAFVSRVMQSLSPNGGMNPVATGEATPYLGVAVIDMGHELAQRLSYPHPGGVFVSGVTIDSPADSAEIVRGDIITAIAGNPVRDSDSLRLILRQSQSGQVVPLTIWRDGRTEQLELRIP